MEMLNGAVFSFTLIQIPSQHAEPYGLLPAVITEGSNPYGYKNCDGVWIEVTFPLGDLNSDNKITSDDLFLLQSYLTNNITLTESQGKAADLNEDGLVDGFDLALLRQKLA